MNKKITHLTLTGYYAGVPFCNCNKDEETKNGNDFTHYACIYHLTDEQILNSPDYCPNCKKELKDYLESDNKD
jgi:hypothetical protein